MEGREGGSVTQARFTVIMRTKNSEWILGQTLKALFSQVCDPFELHVVDSGSTDGTLELVRRYPAKITEIQPKDYFPGQVLNAAIETAETPLVVFLNSDTVLTGPGCLQALIRAFDEEEVQAAFGRQVSRPEAWLWVQRDYAQCFPKRGNPPEWISLSLPIAGMRRSIWEERAFYDQAYGSEDTEWGIWARKEGVRVDYVPECTAMHSHNYTLKQLYGRRFIEGEADAFIYGRKWSWGHWVHSWIRGMVRDGLLYSRHKSWKGLLQVPLRVGVDTWAYFRGHQLGRQRLLDGDKDLRRGQREVQLRE